MTGTNIEDLLTHSHVSLRRELLAHGWTDKMIRQGLVRGTLVRVRHGAYVDSGLWRDLDPPARHELVARSAAARAGTSVVVSHSSALALWRSPEWGLDLDAVHLTRPDRRAGRAEAGLRQHRGVLMPDDVRSVRGTAVSSPERALLETTTIVPTEVGLVQANDLLHRKLVTPEGLRARYKLGVRRWPGSLGTHLVLRLANGLCESVAESRFGYLCWRFGLPAPTLQMEVLDEHGRLVAHLDACWPRLKAWVEVDGRVKYTKFLRPGETVTEVVLREKKREDAVRRLTDMRCMRVIWPEIERPEETALALQRFLFPAGPAGILRAAA